LSDFDLTLRLAGADRLPETIADRTRRVYDWLARVYPASTCLFHSRAHHIAAQLSGIGDGMQVLEVATGSGEMFRRLVALNRSGLTLGLDLSPNMAARTTDRIRKTFPASRAHCNAVDVRLLPFTDRSFDAVVCCYLLELLSQDDIGTALREIRRVLRRNGLLTVVLISERDPVFNGAYRACGRAVPAFWGRQVERSVPALLESHLFRIERERDVRQLFYPSRVLVARRR
jgi:ubiquinone/menaquinone biosynthesis C-methylase UbiE